MTISARLQITRAANRRGWTRRNLSLGATLHSSGEEVVIHDLSASGLLVETTAGLAVFDDLEVELPEVGFTPAVVVWNSGPFYGCQFREPISQAAISAAVLRSPPAQSAPPVLPRFVFPAEAIQIHDREHQEILEEKASLTVRLRAILGSAILLWTLIIWGGSYLYELIR